MNIVLDPGIPYLQKYLISIPLLTVWSASSMWTLLRSKFILKQLCFKYAYKLKNYFHLDKGEVSMALHRSKLHLFQQ